MIKLSTLFWLLVVSAAGFAMFAVKYQVQDVADRLARAAKAVDDTNRDVRILDAEWAYLNRPDALAQMNQRFLSLVPIATKQLRAGIADLPMRPAPPPAAPEAVAAAEPGPAAAPAAPASTLTEAAETPGLAAPPQAAQPRPHEQPRPPAVRTRVASVAHDARETARPVRPAALKTAARASPPRRAASLDELIAEIADNRQ